MIRAYSPIPVGTRLSVELKQGDPVEGTVKWVEDGLTGVAFERSRSTWCCCSSAPGDRSATAPAAD